MNSDKNYTYMEERRRYFRQTVKAQKNRIEIINNTRVLHVGNKTYSLGKVSNSNATTKAPPKKFPRKPEGYSIMETPCFIHKAYLEMFVDPLMVPAGAVEYVTQLKDCDDILMSIVVTKFMEDTKWQQCGVLAIKSSLPIKNSETCKLFFILVINLFYFSASK